jgi:hypothetical protein
MVVGAIDPSLFIMAFAMGTLLEVFPQWLLIKLPTVQVPSFGSGV